MKARAHSSVPTLRQTRATETSLRHNEQPSKRGSQKTVIGNQQYLHALGIRARFTVSHSGDADEREADHCAEAFARGAPGPAHAVFSPAATVERAGSHLARKPAATTGHINGGRLGRHMQASRGEPLAAPLRRRYEGFFGADLSSVRVHTDAAAQQAARSISAQAFTRGSDVYFAGGRFAPDDAQGQQLLAHELTHTLQPSPDTGSARLRRQGDDDLVCRADDPGPVCSADTGAPVCEAPTASTQPPQPAPVTLGLHGTLDQRVAAFKRLVRTTAVQRLAGNQRSLDKWAALIRSKLPASVFAAIGVRQTADFSFSAFEEMQNTRNPMQRELLAEQAMGHFRACTGCHVANLAWAYGAQTPHVGAEWLSPNERRRGVTPPGLGFDVGWGHTDLSSHDREALAAWVRGTTGAGATTSSAPNRAAPPARASSYHPPEGSAEAALSYLPPDPEKTEQLLRQAQGVLGALGPDGYHVLPESVFNELRSRSVRGLREEVLGTIAKRRSDYGELIERIQGGDLSYDKFGPIIHDLLPLASADVREAIQQEMDSHAWWEGFKAVVIGVLTVADLLLTIFPPTSLLGAGGMAALDVTLGVVEVGLSGYGVVSGVESMRQGYDYHLATGANNVLSREQQQGSDLMMLGGFMSVVLAPLGVMGGVSRMSSGLSRLGSASEISTALSTVGETVEQGQFIVSRTEDGALIATSTEHPDLLIIARGDTATLYQSMGPGGMRVLATRSLSEAGEFSDAASALGAGESTPLLTSGGEVTPSMDFDAQAQRLDEIIRTGGAHPEDTRAIASAIVDVPGYTGPTELRAISSASTDALGEEASVVHAGTPETRTLSTARSIRGASARGEFPFSHVNDAEIKLYEQIRSQLPPNATGRIHILSLRSRLGGSVIEPLPMCSSCTHATFQQIGDFPGVDVISHSATFPAPTVDLGQ